MACVLRRRWNALVAHAHVGRMAAAGAALWLVFTVPAHAQEPCAPALARVVSVQGTIELRRSGAAWTAVQLNAALCSGDTLRVHPRSRAALLLSNKGEVLDFASPAATSIFGKNGSYNLEINIQSSLFQGRAIDVLIAPEILQKKSEQTATGDQIGSDQVLDPHLASGSLKGLIEMRDGALTDFEQELGNFARSTATRATSPCCRIRGT